MTPRGVRLVKMAIEEFFSLEEITLKHCGSPVDAKVELLHTQLPGDAAYASVTLCSYASK